MGAFGQALAALLELAEVGFALVGVGGDGEDGGVGGAPVGGKVGVDDAGDARANRVSFMNVAVLGRVAEGWRSPTSGRARAPGLAVRATCP